MTHHAVGAVCCGTFSCQLIDMVMSCKCFCCKYRLLPFAFGSQAVFAITGWEAFPPQPPFHHSQPLCWTYIPKCTAQCDKGVASDTLTRSVVVHTAVPRPFGLASYAEPLAPGLPMGVHHDQCLGGLAGQGEPAGPGHCLFQFVKVPQQLSCCHCKGQGACSQAFLMHGHGPNNVQSQQRDK